MISDFRCCRTPGLIAFGVCAFGRTMPRPSRPPDHAKILAVGVLAVCKLQSPTARFEALSRNRVAVESRTSTEVSLADKKFHQALTSKHRLSYSARAYKVARDLGLAPCEQVKNIMNAALHKGALGQELSSPAG